MKLRYLLNLNNIYPTCGVLFNPNNVHMCIICIKDLISLRGTKFHLILDS